MTEYGTVTIWVTIFVIGIATYSLRLSFIHLFGRVDDVPPKLERTLRYVPAAVLAALVVPQLVSIESQATLLDARLIAGVVASAVAWRTENVLATIAAGMGMLWLGRFVLL